MTQSEQSEHAGTSHQNALDAEQVGYKQSAATSR